MKRKNNGMVFIPKYELNIPLGTILRVNFIFWNCKKVKKKIQKIKNKKKIIFLKKTKYLKTT